MSDLITSVIRTIVPIIVGALASWFTTNDAPLDQETVAAVSTALTALFGAAYYIVARLIEREWPKAGLLLGKATRPTYK